MSEVVHYTGKLTQIDIPDDYSIKKYIFEFMFSLADQEEINNSRYEIIELFEDLYYKDFIIIDNILYSILYCELLSDDIARSYKNKSGTIDFEVKYYDGGCSFDEALIKAIENNEGYT